MPNAADIKWFKQNFGKDINKAVAGTAFDLDMMTALACQETGEIWPILRKNPNLTLDRIVALCVGDTLDSDRGRKAFPKTKAELVSANRGQEMFAIAHQALVDMAAHIPSYQGVASKPNKFVHGYGVWQYDLQFFLTDPDYFLQKRYEKLDATLGKAIDELKDAQRKVGFAGKTALDDMQMAIVAIAYNTGGYNPQRGLKQGFKSEDGRFYGELIFDFIRLSRTVAVDGGPPAAITAPAEGTAIMPPPSPVTATGQLFVVDTVESPLRLRSEPQISDPPGENVIAQLPDGQPVRAVGRTVVNGFREIETNLHGALLHGFGFAKFLKPAPANTPIPIEEVAVTPPAAGIVEAELPAGSRITRRVDLADAHSLNEANQPSRKGNTPADLVGSLSDIIDWLAVDDPDHRRYQPRDGLTFCNIYTHDYCTLAGVYLTRVWWTQRAIIDLTAGRPVKPLIGNTVVEMRANDIFRWLRDFGASFGWRQTGTLTKLQQQANQGGIGLIIARRKEEGRSGHMVMVVPETDAVGAKRNAAGDVIAPVQSQAGAVNFRRGTGTLNWWSDDRFAESAFWIHA